MTLTEFLLARIAEDEAIAQAATPGPWGSEFGGVVELRSGKMTDVARCADLDMIGIEGYTYGPDDQERADALHIAHWHPARIVAECEAKRQIIEWHKAWPVLVETSPTFDQSEGESYDYARDGISSMTLRMLQRIAWATEQQYREKFGSEPPTGPILRLLALPYADHPDYREEWRPQLATGPE